MVHQKSIFLIKNRENGIIKQSHFEMQMFLHNLQKKIKLYSCNSIPSTPKNFNNIFTFTILLCIIPPPVFSSRGGVK